MNKKEIKEVTDYIWKMINSKDLQKYKFGYHTKVIANIVHLTTIIKQQAKKEVFDDIDELIKEDTDVSMPDKDGYEMLLIHPIKLSKLKKKHLQPK